MAMDLEALLSIKHSGTTTYGDTETMLYALGVGMGRDPMNEDELKFVNEKDLKTVPTMCVVLGGTYDASGLARCGIDTQLILHGEERLTLHQPLPPEATIKWQLAMTDVFDKGAGKGAVIMSELNASLEDGSPLFTLQRCTFARGNGGQGGRKEGAPQPQPIPERKADIVCELDTKPDQALLYRLSGDRNPLHSEPAFAKGAGFDRPILHGLCSFGTACRAVLTAFCNYDHTRIKSFDVRFSSPVFPGETLSTEIWDEGEFLAFRTKVVERDVVVLNNGRCGIA